MQQQRNSKLWLKDLCKRHVNENMRWHAVVYVYTSYTCVLTNLEFKGTHCPTFLCYAEFCYDQWTWRILIGIRDWQCTLKGYWSEVNYDWRRTPLHYTSIGSPPQNPFSWCVYRMCGFNVGFAFAWLGSVEAGETSDDVFFIWLTVGRGDWINQDAANKTFIGVGADKIMLCDKSCRDKHKAD